MAEAQGTLPFDAGDAASVKEKTKAAKQAHLEEIEFLVAAMGTVQGRKWFYNLLVRCHLFQNPYSGTDRGTAFNCGEMNIGLPILADLNTHCVDLYLLMMKENQSAK